MDLNNQSLDSPETPNGPYILAQVGHHRIAFPVPFVSGILLVERSQVLALPFYDQAVLGVVHHQGQLVPLVMLQQLLEDKPSQLREVFNAVQLSSRTSMAGLGLAIDQMLGNCSAEQLAADSTIEPFQLQILNAELWQPSRWKALAA